MKPFCHASLVSADKCNLPLSLDDGWRCRVALIAPGIGRMLMLPPEGLRELRTWSVLNGADPWQGADRLGLFADAAPATLTQDHDNLSLDNGRLRVRVSLAPFGLAWDQSSDGNTWQACCADRPTFAYANATTGALGHWQARDGHDQYFGLGDKTGPLNKAGRQLRLRLMPYLYTLMWQARQRHRPVLRPSFYDFDDDTRCWDDDDAVADSVMVRPDLLLAPVFAPGARERRVYLPLGAHAPGWFDLAGERYWPGGSEVAVAAPLDQMPIFVRAGALLTMAASDSDARLTEEPSRLLRYYPPPDGDIAVELPTGERRPLTLRPDRVPMFRR